MAVAINQFGTIRCPICDNTIEWSYKLESWIPNGTDRLATAVESVPDTITHFATEDGIVYFRIGCKNCGSAIETNTMPLVAHNNEKSAAVHAK